MSYPSYTPELAAEICKRLAAGESLRAICRDVHMPDRETVARWAIDDHEGFAGQYARARDIGIDMLAEEAIEVADTPRKGRRIEFGPEGRKVVTDDMLGHRRLQVDTRKWYTSKLAPKRYGDRLEIDGKLDTGGKSREELLAELQELRGKAAPVRAD